MFNKYFFILSIGLFFIAKQIISQTEKTYELEDVVVTAGRIPSFYNKVARDLNIITNEQIKSLPVDNLQDVLNYYSSIDLKKRGPEGIQADVSIRGGSFEQTLILIDGIKMTDAQTAHFNLNLPLNLENIERIEILKGQGSKIFGPNAFSGLINIITKKNQEESVSFKATGGNFGYYSGSLSAAYSLLKFNNRISISKSKSDGYRYNTDFDISTFSFSSSLNLPSGNINFLGGFTNKEYGANSFYSDKYPGQRERTKTGFLALSTDLNLGQIVLQPKVYYRKNTDDYLLEIDNPEFYHNNHISNSYGVELQSYVTTPIGAFAVGWEISKDKIESTNLGDHERSNGGVSFEYNTAMFADFNLSVGGFIYNYGNFGWHFWPGIDLGYEISTSFRLFGSVGKSFRIPSYTDLYYNSPAQKGNGNLQPEEAITYESGFKWNENTFTVNSSIFRREGKNLIDWVKYLSTEPWQAKNILKMNTNGFDVDIILNIKRTLKDFSITKININYTYLNSDKKSGQYQSKYVFDYLRHKLVLIVYNNLFFGVNQCCTFRFEDRLNLEKHFIADTKLNYNYEQLGLFIEATNLFNTTYSDFPGIPMPGRWIIVGLNFEVKQ
jgi:vitamin B12 transporter